MSILKRFALGMAAVAAVQAPVLAVAETTAHSTVGVGGYDPVSYHVSKKPLRGNGNHVAVHDGVTYVFANEENRKTFDRSPDRYVPAYGGWCAYGVSVGKKFVGDPDVWKIVDGRLYLNLDTGIQAKWQEDIAGNIAQADSKWPSIQNRLPSEL